MRSGGLQKGGTRLTLTSPGRPEKREVRLWAGTWRGPPGPGPQVRAGPGHLEDGTQSGAELLPEPRLLNTPSTGIPWARHTTVPAGRGLCPVGWTVLLTSSGAHPPGLLYLVSGRPHRAGEERQQSETKSPVSSAGPGAPRGVLPRGKTQGRVRGLRVGTAGSRRPGGSRTHGRAADQAPCCPPSLRGGLTV